VKRREFLQATGAVGGATLLPGADAERVDGVEIRTDEYGVSHVYADDLYGLGFGQGYVQTRDRLFQLDVLRRLGYGTSASLLGAGQLKEDLATRRTGYSGNEIREMYETAPEEMRTVLAGYAAGVNEQIAELEATGSLPGEFSVFDESPDPWEPADSVAVMVYLLERFGVSGGTELRNARELVRLTRDLGGEEIFEGESGSRDAAAEAWAAFGDRNWLRVTEDHYTSIPRADRTVDGGEDALSLTEVPQEQLESARAAADAETWGTGRAVDPDYVDQVRESWGAMAGVGFGSNAMAVAGEYTETGRPMLFGGPQMGLVKPPVIYETGMHGAGFDVVGVAVVGTPAVIIGRTPEFAWTATSGGDDMVDVIAVDIHPDDRTRYRWDGEWRDMECETVVHDASGAPDIIDSGDSDFETDVVEQTVCRVREDGAVMPVVAWNETENVAFVQRRTTRYDEVTGAYAWLRLGRQTDREGFAGTLGDFPFSFNFVYADEEDIALYHTGTVPERNDGYDQRLPVPADGHEWSETTNALDLGTYGVNPSRGYIVNWNNAPVGGWRAGDNDDTWGVHSRVELLDAAVREQLSIADGSLSFEDVVEILRKAGTRDSTAPALVPDVARVATADAPTDSIFIDVADRGTGGQLWEMGVQLSLWASMNYARKDVDDTDVYDHAGITIWEETWKELSELAFRAELGSLAPSVGFEPGKRDHYGDQGASHPAFVAAVTGRTDYDWLEDREAAIRTALERAAATLEDRYGSADPADWRRAEHTSQFFAIGGALEDEIDMVNRGTYNHVVALGEGLPTARSVLPPSNTGYLTSDELSETFLDGEEPDRLTDQLDLYRNVEFKPLPVTRAEVDAVAVEDETVSYSRGVDLSKPPD